MPVFRLVVAEHTMPIQGRFIEKLGMFVSGRKKETLMLKTERIQHWLSVGAQPSQTVARLLLDEGMKECEKFIKQRKQVPSKAEVKAKEEKVAAENAKKEEVEAKEKAAQEKVEEEAVKEKSEEVVEEKTEEK